MTFIKTTESSSNFDSLENSSLSELLSNINKEDQTVALSVQKQIPAIEKLVTKAVECLKKGGRLFYIGAGTSGRLGVVDASECPPTFGVSADLVNGLIAGGDAAIRQAVENAEDDEIQAWKDLENYDINENDFVIGIAASGTTPYVLGGLRQSNHRQINTGCIVCNEGSPIALEAKFPVVVVVGPEFVTGSSRMKAGTAQKLVLNMISTTAMIQLGRVKGNKMVDMQLSNEKLVNRGVNMIISEIDVSAEVALQLLKSQGSVRKAVEYYQQNN